MERKIKAVVMMVCLCVCLAGCQKSSDPRPTMSFTRATTKETAAVEVLPVEMIRNIVEETTAPETETTTEPETQAAVNEYGFTDEEIVMLASLVYFENGCCYPECSYQTVYLTACVVLNRYLDWGYSSLSAVIYAPGQYSTADRVGCKYNEISMEAVQDALADLDRNPHYQAMFSQGEIYYQDPVTGECFCY